MSLLHVLIVAKCKYDPKREKSSDACCYHKGYEILISNFIYVCRYNSGDRLRPEHERTILERLLPHHPEYEKKIGCGVDYITVFLYFAIQHIDLSKCLFLHHSCSKSF